MKLPTAFNGARAVSRAKPMASERTIYLLAKHRGLNRILVVSDSVIP